MKTTFPKKLLSVLLVIALTAASICAFADPTSDDAAPDIFNNGYIRGSYYRENGRLFYNIEKLRKFDGEIYTALYDGDENLIDAKVGKSADSFEASDDSDYKIKAYVWDKDQAPLCEPVVMNSAAGKTEVVKGIVVGNSVTTLNGAASNSYLQNYIRVQVLDYSGSDGKYDSGYDGYTPEYDFALASDNIADYFGHLVAFNVSAEPPSSIYELETISSVMPLDAASITTFDLDQFCYCDESWNSPAIYFMNNENDRLPTRATIDGGGAYVVYNGICGYSISETFAPMSDPENNLYKVAANSAYSGQVTLIDNNATAGYDFILVDLSVCGVVHELSNRGDLSFKNAVGSRNKENLINRIEFESAYPYAHINITKDGRPYDYKQLKEWDALSIVANTSNSGCEYYNIEVLDRENSSVTGTIGSTVPSETSSTAAAYEINGTIYDVAEGAYTPAMLMTGTSGTFYIDKYGKIVAYCKYNDSINCAYILNAELTLSSAEQTPMIQILYRDGTIADVAFDKVVSVSNPTDAFEAEDYYYTLYMYQYHDEDSVRGMLDSIVGTVVELTLENGYLKTLTLPVSRMPNDMDLKLAADADNFEYNQYKNELKIGIVPLQVADDAVVFFIGRPGDGYEYKKPAKNFQNEQGQIKPENGEIIRGSELLSFSGSGEKKAAAYNCINEDDYADIIVIYNSENVADPNVTPPNETELMSEISFITNVTTDGGVLRVSYYQNGELRSAVTAPNLSSEYLTVNTQPGTLLKLEQASGIITAAEPLLTFDGEALPDIIYGDSGVPRVSQLRGLSADDTVIYGAVVGRNGKRIYVAPMNPDDSLPDFNDVITYVAYSDADKLYLYDSAASSKCGIGSIGDIYVDQYLAGDKGVSTGFTIYYGPFSWENPVSDMLDYIYILDNGESSCMVFYKRPSYMYSVG